MKWGNVYWPIYLSVAAAFFLIPEVIALATNHFNDLSQYCWRELGVTKAWTLDLHTLAWWLSLFAWIITTVLLIFHIWFRAG